jgi:hypothetical protein
LFEAAPIVAWPAATEPLCGRALAPPASADSIGASPSAAAATNAIARRKRRRVGPGGVIAVLDKIFHRKTRGNFLKVGFYDPNYIWLWRLFYKVPIDLEQEKAESSLQSRV